MGRDCYDTAWGGFSHFLVLITLAFGYFYKVRHTCCGERVSHWSWGPTRREKNSLRLQDDQLYCIAKGNVEQRTDRVAHLVGDGLGGVAEEAGEGDDGNGIEGEDDRRRHAGDVLDHDAQGHKHQEGVEPRVEQDLRYDQDKAGEQGERLPLLVLAAVYDIPRPLILRRCRRRRRAGLSAVGGAVATARSRPRRRGVLLLLLVGRAAQRHGLDVAVAVAAPAGDAAAAIPAVAVAVMVGAGAVRGGVGRVGLRRRRSLGVSYGKEVGVGASRRAT